MIYLASPYTHSDFKVMEKRYEEAMAYSHYLLERKRWVYSPILHCHELAKHHDLPTDHEYWKRYNYHMLARSDELYVLGIEGWRASKGIRSELEFWSAAKHPSIALWVQGATRTALTYNTDDLIDQLDGVAL